MLDIDSIKIRALRAVLKPDINSAMRRLFRWYSSTYSTPLHLVDRLPIEDILTAWFEEHFANLEGPLLDKEIHLMSLSAEERAAEYDSEEAMADAFAAQIAAELANPAQKPAFPKENNLVDKLDDIDPLAPPPKRTT